jgi:hypothetical protein
MNQIIGIIGMLLSFVLGSYLVLKDRTMESLWAGLAAFAFLLVAVIDWKGILGGFKRKLKTAPSAAPKRQAVRPGRGPAASAPPLAATASLGAWWARFGQWSEPREVSVSWASYLGCTLALLAAGQALIFLAGHYLSGWFLTALALLLVGQFAMASDERFKLTLVPTFPALMASFGLGVLLEIFGFFVSYHDHPYIGFAAILVASAALIYGLWWQLELPARFNGGEQFSLRAFELPDTWSARSWAFKSACLLLAVFAFVVGGFLSNFEQIVMVRSLGAAALMLSFPWGSTDIRLLSRGNVALQRSLSLGILAVALVLGYRGESLVYQGVFGSGLSYFLVAIILWIAVAPGPEVEADNGGPTRWELGLFVALMAIGGFMRLWHVGSMPMGVEGDEAGYGIWADDLLHMRVDQIFIHYTQSLYWFWAGAAMLKFFGITPTAVRLHSVFHGTLSLATFYLFMRLFFNWRTALAAAALMCVNHWHLHFSRFGHYNITQGFAQAICFYFLFRAARRRSLLDFILAGIGLSIACQAHVAARLIPPFLVIFLLYLFFFHRKAFIQLIPGIIIVVVSSWILLSGPWIQYARRPNLALARVKEVSIVNEENSNAPADVLNGFITSAKASILMFNYRGDSRPRDNWLAPEPMMDFWTSILWVLGFGLCLYRWRRPLYGFTLIAFFGTLMASAMSVEAPQSLRTAGNITFVFMMVGIAIEQVRWTVEGAFGKAGKMVFFGLLAALLWVTGKANVGAYLERAKTQTLDSLPTMIGLAAQNLGKDGRVDFQSEWFGYSHPPVQFFSQGVPDVSHADIVMMLPSCELPPKGQYFAFSDRFKPGVVYARQLYPEGKEQDIPDPLNPHNPTYYDGWFVTGDQLKASHGFKVQYGGPGGQTQAAVDGVLVGEGKMPAWASSAEWTGAVYAAADTEAKVYLQGGAGSSELFIDGTRVSGTRGSVVDARRVRLVGGLHSVKVRWHGSGNPGRLVWDRLNVGHLAPGFFELLPGQGGLVTVDSNQVFNSFKPTGLLMQFRTGTSFSGGLPMMKVDPIVSSYWLSGGYGPISLKWTGSITIAEAGNYSFRVADAPTASIHVNGRQVFATGGMSWRAPGSTAPVIESPSVRLNPGRYPIEVEYQSPGGVNYTLQWATAPLKGEAHAWDAIPSAVLEPELRLHD